MKFIVVGGGTGSYNVLRGLKNYSKDITAIVSMFDSGGSTGVLRDEFGMLPPGDVRRCLLALCRDEEQTGTLRDLFRFRFDRGAGLEGHSFGNLLLTALSEIYGNENTAIQKTASLLKIDGKVLPVTLDNRNLCAELADGGLVFGEKNIDVPKHNGHVEIKRIFLDRPAKLNPDIFPAIEEADKIIIGPGDFYTSIMPNFLVEGMIEAIKRSRAKKIFIVNLMTKFGETNNFTAKSFIEKFMDYTGIYPDIAICNNSKFEKVLLKKYAEENAFPVKCNAGILKNIQVIEENIAESPNLIRHDPEKLAKVISEI